jgi:Mrp family chromosome partitioning ATPase
MADTRPRGVVPPIAPERPARAERVRTSDLPLGVRLPDPAIGVRATLIDPPEVRAHFRPPEPRPETRSETPPEPAPAAPEASAPKSNPPERPTPTVEISQQPVHGDLDPRLILLREADSPRAAAFRVLRHRLVQRVDPQVIVVTSAEDGDGKTTVAANLALALGECERAQVLLLEVNLRRPDLATVFGIRPPSCFSDQIAFHRDQPLAPWSVVQVTPSLHVAAVAQHVSGRPLLDGPAIAYAISSLHRVGYDYVVIDTPSVLGSADVTLVEDCAHGVLLAARAGKSSGRAIRRAVEQLAPTKILGVALV